jgi:hypothetical protein
MLKVRNLEKQQEALVRLVKFAEEHGFIPMLNEEYASPLVDEFVQLFTSSSNGTPLTRQELTRLTSLTQVFVSLPVYTTGMAAAWLGVGIDTIRDVIWRSDPPKLKTMKMGHDILVKHSELVRFSES